MLIVNVVLLISLLANSSWYGEGITKRVEGSDFGVGEAVSNPVNLPTPEMKKECENLAIELSKCTDEELIRVQHICVGRPGICDQSTDIKFDVNLIIPIIAGLAAAYGIATIAIMKLSQRNNAHSKIK
ncbi:MAG: hypothetical protein ACREBU_03790 [Nitrososphaera sp.]